MHHKAGAGHAVIHAQAAGVKGFHADAHLVAGGVIPEEAGVAQLGWPIEMLSIAEAEIHLSDSGAGGGRLGWAVMTLDHCCF